ncbi:MAG: segregation/condensation protein A [Chthoniobacterales bacterium]|nr:segregation/condensation protein A [Chthoniobacterales bacterium]
MPADNSFKIRLEVFEGPLDLLLYLVKQHEVDIYDVFIEKIINEYIQYVEAIQEMDLENTGEFLVIASTLLYIKSRNLLPQEQQTPEDDAEEDDPRWELIRQLVEYRRFKEAAEVLRQREALQEALFPRISPCEEFEDLPATPLSDVSLLDLIHAFRRVLKRLESLHSQPREIYGENFTVSEKIDFILSYTQPGVSIRFDELFCKASSRTEVVVTFLAMLELIRLKQIRVRQENSFGEIWLERPVENILPASIAPARNSS